MCSDHVIPLFACHSASGVAQVALEGAVSKKAAMASLAHGQAPQVGLSLMCLDSYFPLHASQSQRPGCAA